jgi:hypothetical protein
MRDAHVSRYEDDLSDSEVEGQTESLYARPRHTWRGNNGRRGHSPEGPYGTRKRRQREEESPSGSRDASDNAEEETVPRRKRTFFRSSMAIPLPGQGGFGGAGQMDSIVNQYRANGA